MSADDISSNLHISLNGWRKFYGSESNLTKWVIEAIIKGISLENIVKKYPAYERKYECGQTRFSVEELREKEEKAQRKKTGEIRVRWNIG